MALVHKYVCFVVHSKPRSTRTRPSRVPCDPISRMWRDAIAFCECVCDDMWDCEQELYIPVPSALKGDNTAKDRLIRTLRYAPQQISYYVQRAPSMEHNANEYAAHGSCLHFIGPIDRFGEPISCRHSGQNQTKFIYFNNLYFFLFSLGKWKLSKWLNLMRPLSNKYNFGFCCANMRAITIN